jgi:hypothetical protein
VRIGVSLYGAHDNDRIVIDNRAAGWVVFYSERGGEFDLQAHPTEDDACRDVLRRLGIRRVCPYLPVRMGLPVGIPFVGVGS